MLRTGSYDEPEPTRPKAAGTEEEQMYPYQLTSMAAEHVKDLRNEAPVAVRVRRVRSLRAGTRSGVAASSAGSGRVRRVVHP
jgi:hypothetical protein